MALGSSQSSGRCFIPSSASNYLLSDIASFMALLIRALATEHINQDDEIPSDVGFPKKPAKRRQQQLARKSKTYFQWIINNLAKRWNSQRPGSFLPSNWNAENVCVSCGRQRRHIFVRHFTGEFVIFPRFELTLRAAVIKLRMHRSCGGSDFVVFSRHRQHKFIPAWHRKSILIAHNNFLLRNKVRERLALSEANY